MSLAETVDTSVSPDSSIFVQPIYVATEAVPELVRSFEAGGISLDAFADALRRVQAAKSDAEIVDIVNGEHLLSPASPDPDRYHEKGRDCGCGRHGHIATAELIEVELVRVD